jgi:hypothetical protein
MKRKETKEQVKLQTEKQHLILRLRLAMETNHYEIVEALALELHKINNLLKK